jgi:hypothetical protein
MGLAAGLFDAADCPSSARLEIALSALARKLKMRAGMVTVHSGDECRVIAHSGDPRLLAKLVRHGNIPRASIFCGKLKSPGQTLTLDYVSLTEWRKHPAFLERGWESYIGIHCGTQNGSDVVVCFFDPSPRGAPFTTAEKSLLQQLSPWIASLSGEEHPAITPNSVLAAVEIPAES